MSEIALHMFAHVVDRQEEEIELAEAALLIAEIEYPNLDVQGCMLEIRALGGMALERVRRNSSAQAHELVLRFMYDELGFLGNSTEYYDPRNSFLNDVLRRRVGVPITLAIVLMELLRAAKIAADGISFPGHFLVGIREGDPESAPSSHCVIDPFDGRMLGPDHIQELYSKATGVRRAPDRRLLEAASKKQILLRMLNNLRSIYTANGDQDRLRQILERMVVLMPSDELVRELEAAGGDPSIRAVSRQRTPTSN